MRALTLTQPWASLIACGLKRIETRSWKTNYRGPLLIHAAQGFPREARALLDTFPFDMLGRHPNELPRGAIVAVTMLEDVRPINGIQPYDMSQYEMAFGNFAPGRYGWLLGPAKPLAVPAPCKGALGLWKPTFEVTA